MPTAVTAFIGRATQGPFNTPVTLRSIAEFEHAFGGVWHDATLWFAVRDFFSSGGTNAVVVRLHNPDEQDDGSGGTPLTAEAFIGNDARSNRRGLYALEQCEHFNLLCIPPHRPVDKPDGLVDLEPELLGEAARYCQERRAILLVDPARDWVGPTVTKAQLQVRTGAIGDARCNAALYFPFLNLTDTAASPAQRGSACGAVAGIIARTDNTRGVWRAPAGREAQLTGVQGLSVELTDEQHGPLNKNGINCLRNFPATGVVIWGGRTLAGSDELASVWKYLPARRLGLYIEASVERGTQWAVFEPNSERLWTHLYHTINAFMFQLFQQGAMVGHTPAEAYFVQCDRQIMTQQDIDAGRINIVIGLATYSPKEFALLKIQQRSAAQVE